jgi:hypothetical protein
VWVVLAVLPTLRNCGLLNPLSSRRFSMRKPRTDKQLKEEMNKEIRELLETSGKSREHAKEMAKLIERINKRTT